MTSAGGCGDIHHLMWRLRRDVADINGSLPRFIYDLQSCLVREPYFIGGRQLWAYQIHVETAVGWNRFATVYKRGRAKFVSMTL
jgi:hypothetical protein